MVKFQNDCVKQKVEVHLLSTFGIFWCTFTVAKFFSHLNFHLDCYLSQHVLKLRRIWKMINSHALRKVMKTTLLTQRIAQVFHLKLIVLCLIQKAGMNL